jgi:hypothetical protein
MKKYIFPFVFIALFLTQWFFWAHIDYLDSHMWGNQAHYFETNNDEQYNTKNAYGHPGGPIIIGVIAIHRILPISYEDSLNIFLALCNTLTIACISFICYRLYKNTLWWIVPIVSLSIHRSYVIATPPSALVAPLIVLLILFTLYIYKRKESLSTKLFIVWGIIAGISIATRFDIGGFISLATFIFLVATQKISFRKFLCMASTVILTFVLLDPFMWYMPITHMHDLFYKMIYHYAEFTLPIPTHISFLSLFDMSFLAFLSVLFFFACFALRKKITISLPFTYLFFLLGISIILYTIFTTSDYEAGRYFLPITFIWELFLPLFLFTLISQVKISTFKKISPEKAYLLFELCIIILILEAQVLPLIYEH